MTDSVLIDLVKSGGVSGTLIAMALLYLSMQVRNLQKSVDSMAEKVFPAIDDLQKRVSHIEGQREG